MARSLSNGFSVRSERVVKNLDTEGIDTGAAVVSPLRIPSTVELRCVAMSNTQVRDSPEWLLYATQFSSTLMGGVQPGRTKDPRPCLRTLRMDLPLAASYVVTIEPGLYLPQEKIGVRIEDDILVTQDGCENLSAGMPRSSADVEAWIARLRTS